MLERSVVVNLDVMDFVFSLIVIVKLCSILAGLQCNVIVLKKNTTTFFKYNYVNIHKNIY